MSEFCIIGSGISGATIANLLNKFENQYKAFYVINESSKDGFRWIMQESIYPDGFTEIQDELSSDKYKQIQNDFGVH